MKLEICKAITQKGSRCKRFISQHYIKEELCGIHGKYQNVEMFNELSDLTKKLSIHINKENDKNMMKSEEEKKKIINLKKIETDIDPTEEIQENNFHETPKDDYYIEEIKENEEEKEDNYSPISYISDYSN